MLSSNEHKAKADEYAINMKKCFEDSQNAWKSGDKVKAKEMSIRGNDFKALLMQANENFTGTLKKEKLEYKNINSKEKVISDLVQMKDLNDKIIDFSSIKIKRKNQDNLIIDKNTEEIYDLKKLNFEDEIQEECDFHRQTANNFAKEMVDFFSQSKILWEKGDKAKANELSNFGHQCKEKMDIHNSYAVKIIATKNNIERDSDEIDLHGLYVNEAIQFFKETLLIKMRDENFKSLKVIVGKGLHSKDKPKLKAAVINFANVHNLKVFEHPDNPGYLIICVL